ncbi:MAG: acyltransferase, partial [Methylacidiphilales bacterium]|nr:acyltransferase [Candidatus Methylacidiphilales bacterium]
RNTFIEKNAILVVEPHCPGQTACLKIGSNCYINQFSFIDCHYSITICDSCLIGPYVYICDFDHVLGKNEFICAPTVIESNTWIGAHACILKGVTIGHHSIIAAGAVVTDSIPPFSIAAGVPARVVKKIQSND